MKKKKRKAAWWKNPIVFITGIAACVLVGFVSMRTNHAEAVSCSSSAATQNGITVVPSHGNVFYIDTGVSPALDAGYIGYRVTNNTGSTQSDLWANVSNFSGSKVTLANSLDANMQMQSLTNGSTGTSYFMLKATGATINAQTHTLKVYNHRPDLSGSALLYQCDFSFSKVQETIKAAANKVANNGLTSSAAIEVSDSSPELGQLVTITVEGQTGQIGQGSTPDFDIIWLTPAAISSWPTRALRLENVSITFDGNGNWSSTSDQVTFTNQLLISNANGLTNVDNAEYRTSYQFRVIGRPNSTVKAVPIAQIASGTQIKHSDTTAAGGTLDLTFSALAINAALTKSVTSTTGLTVVNCTGACAVTGQSNSGQTYVEVPYRLTAASTTATSLTIDEFVDQAPSGVIFKPNSASITDIGRTGVVISDPVTIITDASPKPNHFVGPFTFNSGTTASLNYTMWVPVGAYANIAYARIGDLLIGANSSAMSRITITSTGSSTVGVVTDTVSFSVLANTEPATSVTSSTATINGTVDPNGTSILTGQFQYGTSSTLVGATTTTATTPGSGNLNGLTDPTAVSLGLTGLSPATTYYYRVIAGSAQGSILSFTTAAVAAAPTTTTTAATSITSSAATLNGTINPNLTPITGIQFIYGTSSSLASGNTTTIVDDGSGSAALTAGGSSEQPFSKDITGLSPGTTYYFKIRSCTSVLLGTYPAVTCASFVDGSILSFNTALTSRTLTIDRASYADTYSITAGTPTITSTPSAGTGTKSYASSTTSVCTINSASGLVTFVSAGTCTLTASITSNGVYDSATSSAVSFVISLAPRTLTIDAGSYNSSYALADGPPTITSTATLGGGTKSYSSGTPGVCSIDSSSGLVAFVAVGTCTISASITSDGTYASANAPSISFDVSNVLLSSRTLMIDAVSYNNTYTLANTPPTITSTQSDGTGTKSFSSSTPAVCTIHSSTGAVTFVGVGTCTISSSITSDGTFSSATASAVSFTLSLAPRTLQIDDASYDDTYTLANTPPTITSTQSNGLGPKSYLSSTPSFCTINSSTGLVTFVAAGTCTITASITSDGVYQLADASAISFVLTAAALLSRTLEIDDSSYVASYLSTAVPPTIASLASNGVGTKSYASGTPSVCTINSATGLTVFVATGTCTVSASITSDGTYASADASAISFTVTPPPSSGPPPVSPSGASITIQSGATCVTGNAVNVIVTATNATHVLLANDPLFTESSWLAFNGPSASLPWTLAGNSGPKTVYAMYKNGALQSEVTSDTITLGSAESCDGESPDGDPSNPETPTIPPSPQVPTVGENPSSPAVSQETNRSGPYTYTVSIVNPDGTTRSMQNDTYAHVVHVTSTVDLIRFEDKGSDFDFNDVIVKVDYTNWQQVIVTVLNVDAGWKHNIRFSLSGGLDPLTNALLWADSHLGVGKFIVLNPDDAQGIESSLSGQGIYLNPNGPLPTLPPVVKVNPSPETSGPACEINCQNIQYDVYLVNQNLTERHRNTAYVRESVQEDGSIVLGFEDSGLDFDHNDAIVLLKSDDCSQVTLTLLDLSASWHHQIIVSANYDGEQKFSSVVWPDTQQAVGETKVLNIRDNPLLCEKSSIPTPPNIAALNCSLATPFTKLLGPGSSGSDVFTLQNLLSCVHIFPTTTVPNSYYGPTTTKAVTSFQEIHYLTPSGIVGRLTRAILNTFLRLH